MHLATLTRSDRHFSGDSVLVLGGEGMIKEQLMGETGPSSEWLIVGESPFAPGLSGARKPRIGTVFLRTPGLVTRTALHATQRLAWIDTLNEQHLARGEGPLTEDETEAEWSQSVDLLFDEDRVLIRPDPTALDLAFRADELLQQRLQISKRRLCFLNVTDARVRSELRCRGEYWRMSPVPCQAEEILAHIQAARTGIDGLPIYYYSQTTGTRFLTLQEFESLADKPVPVLRQMLLEIKTFSARRNRQGSPEVDFFLARGAFGRADLQACDVVAFDAAGLRRAHAALAARFRAAVPPALRTDDPGHTEWRNRLFAALVNRPHETATEDIVRGLSPEFFLQIEWLPGARMEEGELLVDPLFAEADANPQDAELQALCDPRAREFIFNYVREFGDIEFVNIGRIGHSLSLRRKEARRSTVYIAEVKQQAVPAPVVRIIRLQKWGIAEHLDEGDDLLTAILRAEEYTDYILDRRLGCRQLGMQLPPHVQTRRISEKYMGPNASYRGKTYWTTYLERDYVVGCASDKLPQASYQNPEFNRRLARLLGEAAAVNLIVGRMKQDKTGMYVLFDDGDEMIVTDEAGLPAFLSVSDHTGTFTNHNGPLTREIAAAYAAPVNRRAAWMSNAVEFADIYIETLAARFEKVQQIYRSRRRAFDALFKHRRWDPNGSLAFRWTNVLKRLDATDAAAVVAEIRQHIILPAG